MSRSARLDVLVAGGGPVGASIALGLADAGRRVALIEPRLPEPHDEQAAWDPRVYALSPASALWLERLRVWPQLMARRHGVYRRMEVWTEFGNIGFDAAELGLAQLGHIVEGRPLVDALWARLREHPRVELHCPRRLTRVDPGEALVRVLTEDGEALGARLLVAADGAASPVRVMLGLHYELKDYGQSAIVTHLRSERPHEDTARQVFLPGGPLALLPLGDGRSSLVWSQPREHAERRLALTEQDFLAELGLACGHCLGAFTACDPRQAFPLRMGLATRYRAQRSVLVGDAAHSVHPLAGQGMNLGLLDAALLVALLSDAEDPGEASRLRRYERRRRSEATLAAQTFDTLNTLFSRPPGPLRNLASIGLSLVDQIGPLKRWLVGHAAGLDRLPETIRRAGSRAA